MEDYGYWGYADDTMVEPTEELPPLNCTHDLPSGDGLWCPGDADPYQCWPPTPANSTVFKPCPPALGLNSSLLVAFRVCDAEGQWQHGNWTNYSACLDLLPNTHPPSPYGENVWLAEALRDIYAVACVISLAFLFVALFIFCYFRCLQCSRNTIHKHLFFSFILRFIIILVMIEPYLSRRSFSYRNIGWLCKVLVTLRQYTMMANFSWMLVEGVFLHNRLVVTVFHKDAPFPIFYAIGWGVPALFATLWGSLMQVYHQSDPCWAGYSTLPLIFIVFAPIVLALMINCTFLVNIIRVLITKLRANNIVESRRIRKAIKATVVLLPLLGITNLLFLLKPHGEGPLMQVYRVINAVLPSCQGIFVSVLYCFMNTEVRTVIRKKWYRFRLNRAMNSQIRRRSSRTSSLFFSQTEGHALSRRKSTGTAL